jgi:hypothetical protein
MRPKSAENAVGFDVKGTAMNEDFQNRLTAGAENLLVNCAGCVPGQHLLVVYETENDGFYDPELARAIGDAGQKLGLNTTTHGVPFKPDVEDPDVILSAKMMAADCTVFVARLGDQIRFRSHDASHRQIITYALDREMLASPFGTIDYRAFEGLKQVINRAVSRAKEIHVTCPAGTDFRGKPNMFDAARGDTTRKRFPVSVFTPIPAEGFRGRIAQNGFITGTGSHYYTPWTCALDRTLFVNFDGSRITGFDGSPDDVAAAQSHYEFVGRKYDLDTYFVHSWHVGIHPGCAFDGQAAQHFERWSGGAFGNPRLLHFHTCGAYPPGEISLNLLDPTVRIDGVAVWENGKLHPERLAGGQALLETYPEMRAIFEAPATQVGQAPCGRLRYA